MATTPDRSTIHHFLSRHIAFDSTPDRLARTITVEAIEFPIRINRPGLVKARATAQANYYREPDDPGPPGQPYTKGTAALAIALLDPDGQPRDSVAPADLDRDRDARGTIHPRQWTLKIPKQVLDDIAGFTSRLSVSLNLVEAERASESAGPLLQRTGVLKTALSESFGFDLHRLGRLTAALNSAANGVSMRLLDPDGSVVATGSNGRLLVTIEPLHLRARGPAGTRPRLWKLELTRPASVPAPAQGWALLAEVHATLRIAAEVVRSRLDALLGPPENPNCTFAFERHDDTHRNRLKLTLNDAGLAETLGIHNALKGIDLLLNTGADPYDYQVGREYVLLENEISGDVGPGGVIDWWVEGKGLRTHFISLGVGESTQHPGFPAILVEARTAGSLEVHIDGPNAHFNLPVMRGELVFKVEGGRVQAEHWIDPDSIQASGIVGKALAALLAVKDRLKDQYSAIDLIVERVFQFFMGGRFTFTAVRWANDGLEFDYLAAVEHSRAPVPGYMPRGKPVATRTPGWVSPNLAKIDHIVVLMMENRSFDHLLGSLSATRPDVDGLSAAVQQQFNAPGHTIRSLAQAAFPVITQFPLSVGHSYTDVSQQMADGMKGFVDNFKAHTKTQEVLDAARCQADDVLGYYPIELLPSYAFLAREYAICDRFFCSHPGPTLPNRMSSITGELQRNLYGEPRLENGVDRNMTLSRDPTVFDILERYGVSWRQYESPPSVSMLRYFARHAGDELLIRDIRELADDVRRNRLPSVTFIDPQMHAWPPNDDHPPSNLLHGQQLVRSVYDALTANPALWSKTLLVISYDEHGGFFDHVVPATAEALPQKNLDPLAISYGVRVPTFLVSPWVPRGGVIKQTLDFTSILKTILVRFCAPHQPFLSDRVTWAEDLGPALSLAQARPLPLDPLPLRLSAADIRAAAAPAASRVNVTMSELVRDDADFHDFIGVLGRAVRPQASLASTPSPAGDIG